MRRGLSLRASAVADVESAFVWYEEQRPGLGAAFVAQVDTLLESLRDRSEAHAVIEHGIRRALLHRFPYGVFYVVERQTVIVLAVLHYARDPSVWRDRA